MLLNATMREQAIVWAVRTSDQDFDDWDSFTQWLEQSAEHAEAYDEAVIAATDAASVLASSPDTTATLPVAANDSGNAANAEHRKQARRWWPAAVAASLALVAGISLWPAATTSYTVETAPGETGMIALEDGSRIDIAGGSRLVLDRDNPRFASLEQGQALFHVVHDEARPFLVHAGDDRLLDAGTVFDVRLNDSGLVVGVSEGLVVYNPDAQALLLEPGKMLVRKKGSATVTTGTIALEQVGEWREGRLTFRDASLASVAQDLSRSTGLSFAAAPGAAAGKSLSGSILVEPVKDNPGSLGSLLGVSVRQAGDQWLIDTP